MRRVSAGSDATSIYVANSNVYQESVVRVPWRHASPELAAAIRQGGARWERTLTPIPSTKPTPAPGAGQ